MVKRGKLYLSLLAITILLAVMVSGSFDLGETEYSLDQFYGPNNPIRGWINISFTNQLSNSTFHDDKGNSINLLNLINTSSNSDYEVTCDTLGCVSNFNAENPQTQKTLTQPTIIGFKFNENINDISSINFTINSDASPSCFNQLEIDFFLNGEIDTGNNIVAPGGSACSFLRNYGCFDTNLETGELTEYGVGSVSGSKHCQKVSLSESPAFKIGAWVRKESGNLNLTAALHTENGEEVGTCDLKDDVSNSGEQVSCDINHAVTEAGEYFVCVYSSSGTGDYKVRGYEASLEQNSCAGFSSIVKEGNFAFEIFSEGKRFGTPGTININNPNNLGNRAKEYLQEVYGSGLDCSSKDCIVPILFDLKDSQTVTLSNLKITASTGGGLITKNTFYDLTEIPAKLSSDFQRLYLNGGNFTVPGDFGSYNFILNLDGEEILNQETTVESVPIVGALGPLNAPAGVSTRFSVSVTPENRNYTYRWNFGDGKTNLTTPIPEVSHTYDAIGNYKLKISVTDQSNRTSSREFTVSADSPNQFVNDTLKAYQKNLDNVKLDINSYNLFEQTSLDFILNITSLEDTLRELQTQFQQALDDSDHINIATKLNDLEIPESLDTSRSANSVPFDLDENNINLNILSSISNSDYDPSERSRYNDAIIGWSLNNLNTNIDFKEISASYDSISRPVLRTFNVKIREKPDVSVSDNSFFIIKNIDDLKFKENYLESQEAGYTFIEITRESIDIEFSTTENVDFANLPAFISPNIDRLQLAEDIRPSQIEGFRWGLFFLIVGLLILIGIVVYIILYQWYKNRYENYLFKNKNNLYNLFNYIEISKKRGATNKEIISKLRKAGWNSEQIQYAMRKYLGKMTGMYELPLMKVLRGLKKKKKIPQKPGRDPFKMGNPQRYGGNPQDRFNRS